MAEKTIQDHVYEIGKMDAWTQFLTMKRLLPVFTDIVPALAQGEGALIVAVGDGLAKLSDEDATRARDAMFAKVQRKAPNGLGYFPILKDGVFMYPDMDLKTILGLLGACIMENFGGFFAEALSRLHDEGQKLSGPLSGLASLKEKTGSLDPSSVASAGTSP